LAALHNVIHFFAPTEFQADRLGTSVLLLFPARFLTSSGGHFAAIF